MSTTAPGFAEHMQPSRGCKLPEKLSCCVLTYALIPGGWAETFIQHYKNSVDGKIYIMCPDDLCEYPEFQDAAVCLLPLPRHDFQDRLVADMFERFSSILLFYHKAVIIPDMDELFVPVVGGSDQGIPIKTSFTSAVMNTMMPPKAIRALGLNVLQLPGEESFANTISIWTQRRLIHPLSAMNKIAILFRPCKLSNGKHFSSELCPAPLYRNQDLAKNPGFTVLNFHMHHACESISSDSRKSLLKRAISSGRVDYFQTNRKKEYPFLRKRIQNGKVICPVLDLDSTEVNNWIHAWNSSFVEQEKQGNGFWTTAQTRPDFLVRMPHLI